MGSRQSLIKCVNSAMRTEFRMDRGNRFTLRRIGMTYASRTYPMGCEDKRGSGQKNEVGINFSNQDQGQEMVRGAPMDMT